MKRIALVLIFAISLIPAINAAGAVKPGSSCAKLGSTSIAAGKKFTCVKSGKKIVKNPRLFQIINLSLPENYEVYDYINEGTNEKEKAIFIGKQEFDPEIAKDWILFLAGFTYVNHIDLIGVENEEFEPFVPDDGLFAPVPPLPTFMYKTSGNKFAGNIPLVVAEDPPPPPPVLAVPAPA